MILKPEHEAKLQPDTTDSMGFEKESYDSAEIPVTEEFEGVISESLVRALQSGPVQIEGLSMSGNKITVRLTLSGGFINFDRLIFGYPIGRRDCVGLKLSKTGFWTYSKKFSAALEDPSLTLNHVVAKIHNYIRV